jgi:hypothetical protein
MTGIVYDLDEPEVTRFWSRVHRSSGCWEWMGSRTTAGYGNTRLRGRNEYAHRISYRIANGPLEEGLVIDHLCRNRACVRPEHLEAVLQLENVRRGAAPYGAVRTTCRQGHDVTDPANVYKSPRGDRRCRLCASERNTRRTEARRARGDLRKVLHTHCKNGHPFDEANTYITPTGARHCRACTNARARMYREARHG